MSPSTHIGEGLLRPPSITEKPLLVKGCWGDGRHTSSFRGTVIEDQVSVDKPTLVLTDSLKLSGSLKYRHKSRRGYAGKMSREWEVDDGG